MTKPIARGTICPGCASHRPSGKSEDAGNAGCAGHRGVHPSDDATLTRRSFAKVFAFLPADRRAAVIGYYQTKHHCSEIEAMKFAIIDRQNDEERYH
jgi:hypothetical protein